jgi:antitoxin CptB
MHEVRRRRACYRAWRRGFREADLILGPFADARVAAMSAAQLSAFERLLDVPDTDLYAWITGATSAPAPYDDDVLADLRASTRAGLAARGG